MILEEESMKPACENPKEHQTHNPELGLTLCDFKGECPYKVHGRIRINTDYCTYTKKSSGRFSKVEV